MHKGKATRVEKIVVQTSKLHTTWSLYLEALRGPSGFGCYAKNPAEIQRQIDAEVDTLIKMSLGFAMDPSRRKVAAAMGGLEQSRVGKSFRQLWRNTDCQSKKVKKISCTFSSSSGTNSKTCC